MILPAPCTLRPGGIALVSACALIKNCFFLCCSITGLVDTNPVGYKSQVFWEPVLLVSLKSWSAGCGVQTLRFSGGSWELEGPSQLHSAAPQVDLTVRVSHPILPALMWVYV